MEPPSDDPNRPEEITRDPNAFELAERLDVDLDDLCERLRVLEIG